MVEKKETWSATGRRKTAVARVCLVSGDGKWMINKREMKDYFPSEALRAYIEQPMKLTSTQGKYDIPRQKPAAAGYPGRQARCAMPSPAP